MAAKTTSPHPPTNTKPEVKVKQESLLHLQGTSSTAAVWKIDQSQSSVTLATPAAQQEIFYTQLLPLSWTSLFPPLLLSKHTETNETKNKQKESPKFCLAHLVIPTNAQGQIVASYNDSKTWKQPNKDLIASVLLGLEALATQIAPRKQMSILLQDDFKRKDKSMRVEMQRAGYRPETRTMLTPQRLPLSPLLNPALTLQVPATLHTEILAPNTPIPFLEPPTIKSYASLPLSMMKADREAIYNGNFKWGITPKANGLWFNLVWCTFFGEAMWLLVDRGNKVYRLCAPDIAFPAVLHDGTVLQGELIPLNNTDDKFRFLVYNCIQTCGVPCGELVFPLRLQNAHHTLQAMGDTTRTLLEQKYGLDFQIKPIFELEQTPRMLEEYFPTLEYKHDGFILMALDAPEQPGLARITVKNEIRILIFKVKNQLDNTIDFAIRRRDHQDFVWELYVVDGPYMRLWCTIEPLVALQTTAKGLAERLGAKQLSELEEKIVECRYDKDLQTWLPETWRQDKTSPNTLSTAKLTWQNIQEAMRLIDLFPAGTLDAQARKRIADWEKKYPNWQVPTKEIENNNKLKPLAPNPASFLSLSWDALPDVVTPLKPFAPSE